MVSVCRYNHDIADYALTVASPAASGEALAAMLIKSSQPSSLAVTPAPNILPASAVEPLPLPPPPIQIWKNEPTLAVRPLTPTSVDPQLQSPWTSPAAHVKNEPTLAPPHGTIKASGTSELTPRSMIRPAAKNEPTLAPPRELPPDAEPTTSKRPLVPLDSKESKPSDTPPAQER
jgi:hypothetical protein